MIDERLGGTTSLEIVVDGKQKDYWLEPQNLETLRKIHRHAEQLPNVGKVSSLDTLIEILTAVNDGVPPNKFILNLARASLAPKMQQAYLLPLRNQRLCASAHLHPDSRVKPHAEPGRHAAGPREFSQE